MAKIMPSVMKTLGGAAEAKKAATIIRAVNHWADIMGAELATKSAPVKITAKKQKNRDTGEQETIFVLKLKAEGSLGTTIAMRETIILDRLNRLFGTDQFKKLIIEHGTITLPVKKATKSHKIDYDLNLPDIDDLVLKSRLESLGQAVMNSAPHKKDKKTI